MDFLSSFRATTKAVIRTQRFNIVLLDLKSNHSISVCYPRFFFMYPYYTSLLPTRYTCIICYPTNVFEVIEIFNTNRSTGRKKYLV